MEQKIKEKIELLKSAKDLETQKSIAKDLLINTSFLEKENAWVYFCDENSYTGENHLKRFLEYKKSANGEYIDCDVSLLNIVMYTLLNENLSLENIYYQDAYNKNEHKFEIRTENGKYKGDTLTSVLESLKKYLGCLWKEIDSKTEKQEEEKAFYDLFDKVSHLGVPIVSDGNREWLNNYPESASQDKWIYYCCHYSDIIWEVMDIEAQDFLRSYFKFGNYMCVPGESYKKKSFNTQRSNYGKWDTVDTLLWKIYMYFETNDEEFNLYLYTIFSHGDCSVKGKFVKETMRFFDNMGITSWENFVEKNCLEDFVSEDSLKPISMKTGEEFLIDEDEISMLISKDYNAIPQNRNEFKVFFKQLSNRINARSKRLYEKIKGSSPNLMEDSVYSSL